MNFVIHFSMLFKYPSFVFHYFIFYGKTALQPSSYAVKMFVAKMSLAKMLTAKVPKTSNNSLTKLNPRSVRYGMALKLSDHLCGATG